MTDVRPRPPDDGSGTVLVLAVVLAAMILASLGAALGPAVSARHAAEAAADLAALAAAATLPRDGPEQACRLARDVSVANGARLTACRPSPDGTVTVTVIRRLTGVAALSGAARASARAGPAMSQSDSARTAYWRPP